MSFTITQPDTTITETDKQAKPRLHPRRTLNRLALALAGVTAAIIGQLIFQHGSIWDGLIFYSLALVLFIGALINHPYPGYRFSLTATYPAGPLIHHDWRRMVGIWLILLALGFSFFAYRVFEAQGAHPQAWQIYLVSLLLLLCGSLLLTPGSSPGAELRRMFPNQHIVIAFLFILGLALFMRLYNFTEQPFGIWYDEAEAGLQAREMLQDDNYRPLFYPPINVTGHLLATYALALHWLGDNIYAMRFTSVLFGLGGVIAAFLFGQILRGPRFGLALAFLVAVARWHVNFSRIAMTGVDSPFFEFLSLFFLVRFFRYGRLRDALWAGLTLGFGLMYYTAFRLYLVALIIFVALTLIRWPFELYAAFRQSWQRYAAAATLLVVSACLVVMPLAKFALDNPEAFWYRTRQISIFTKRDQADLSQALWNSATAHLLMFNFLGDKNGRHNLPGEPMLDPVTAILFVLGLGLALARTRYPANTFFLLLFPITLAGGIFSVDFEAPQSLRSIAVIPAVIYFAGLALAALGREAEKALRPLPPIWLIGPAAAVAAYIFIANTYTYFGRQADDFASWNAFSAPETITGRQMAKLGPDYEFILSPFLTNHPSTQFLAPEIKSQQWLDLPDALPVRDPSGKPVALFIHPDDAWVFEKAKRIYPNARFEIFSGPPQADEEEGPPSVYFVELQPADLMSVRGLELRYWPMGTEDEDNEFLLAPLQSSRAHNINTVWPADSPTETDFVAEWNGTLYAPRYGPYTFRLLTPASGLLEIDGNPILEGYGEQLAGVLLAQGNHRIRLRAEAGVGQVALYWQPPGLGEELIPAWALYAPPIANHGLLASFYTNNNWEGQPALQRIDPFLDTYFHLIPFNRPYTVEWSGSLIAPQTGIYHLALRVVQEAELFIDGQHLLTTLEPNQITEASLSLEAGLHNLRLRYRDSVDRSRVHLYWQPPNGTFEPIPSEFLWPPMGDYPDISYPVQDSFEPLPLELKHLVSLGSPGSEPGQFLEPRDVALLSNGNLVIADTGNRRVQIFDWLYNYLTELNGDELPFVEPLAVGVNSQDEIFVLDSTLQWVYRYDAEGNFINRFGGPEARLFHPRGLTVFEDDTLALADTGSARIAFFDPIGEPSGSLGSLGYLPGQLYEPTDILKDGQGTFFVVEAENDRIQRLDAGGNSLTQWPIPPALAYNGPHLVLAPDGSILMTEAQTDALLRYSPSGTILNQWHTIDSVTLIDPVGIDFDALNNLLYVTDVGTHQVYVFELGAAAAAKLGDN
jgi:hypothetical protein